MLNWQWFLSDILGENSIKKRRSNSFQKAFERRLCFDRMAGVTGIFERISFLLQKSLFVFHGHRFSFCGIYTFVNICKSKKYCLFLSMSDGNLDADIARTMEDFATDELSFEEVAQIVDELPENLRVVLSMRLKGFKYFEIAAHTGMPLGLVKSRIFYGKKRLKEILSSF